MNASSSRFFNMILNSITEVAESKAVPWIETPDQVMAWGVAFGLNRELERLLASVRGPDETAATTATWTPSWWIASSHAPGFHAAGGGAAGGLSPGLFSASAIPNPGAIFAAIGSIASTQRPSTGSGGGGGGSSFSSGSFGGGGGGGGGGAGGGF